MTTHLLTTVFNGKMAFTADINGHKILMDIQLRMAGKTAAPAPNA